MSYELVIVWNDGTTEVFEYASERSAYRAGKGLETAFGGQIEWYYVREKVRV